MPEGPEVKVITEGLRNAIIGKRIKNVRILGGRYKKK